MAILVLSQSLNIFKFVSVLLSASVKRVGVSVSGIFFWDSESCMSLRQLGTKVFSRKVFKPWSINLFNAVRLRLLRMLARPHISGSKMGLNITMIFSKNQCLDWNMYSHLCCDKVCYMYFLEIHIFANRQM